MGIKEILEKILFTLPPPEPPQDDTIRALVFDSHYDPYRGVMMYVRIMSGQIGKKTMIQMMATGNKF